MIHKKKFLVSIFLIVLCCLIFAGIGVNTGVCDAEEATIAPAAQLFELPDNNDYNIEGQQEVTSFAYGRSSLGTFSISGSIEETSSYRGKTAYGVLGELSFSYSYDGFLQGNGSDSWNLSADTATVVNDYNLTGSIGQGAVLIQTSTNGSFYENAVNPITDFFSNKKGRENFYTTDGSAVAQGCFYRVIVAYETCRKTGTKGFWPFKKDVYEFKNNVEVYEFFVCRNDAQISIHNLSVDNDLIKAEGYQSEVLKRSETLTDGATTTDGFSIDKLGASFLVSVAKDGEPARYVDDGEIFTENGKYTITTITKLGKRKTQTVYVFNGGEDKGFSTYFQDYIVHGERVYRDEQYPVYARNSFAFIKAIDESIPVLMGVLENKTTGEVFSFAKDDRNEQRVALSAGIYYGVFYSGDPNSSSGSLYQYTFVFSILDEDSAPFINYNNLMNTQNLEDLGAKHYEVAYPMTYGGYIFVCFSLDSYQAAFNYAYDIEGRFIEKAEDGGLYYKSEKNPNKKEKYYDPIELTRVRNVYAKQNVEYNYFNATDKYTYRTLESVEELEKLNLPESVKVFATNADKDKLINRQPFINNFTFINVADFDVTSVKAYCYKNGKTYSLEFGKKVSEQLSVSSKYRITETNVYGKTREYDVYYVLENLTRSEWEVSYNGNTEVIAFSIYDLESGVKTITADSIKINSITNDFDTDSIVTIKAPNVYSFEIKCSLSELKNVELYKQGRYEITFIDRLGNSYKLIVNLTGKTRYSSLKENSLCYTDFYNTIYMNQKDNSEELILNIEDLKELIETVIERDKYTSDSYNVYQIRLQEAENVYNNPNSTQEEINEAAKNLRNAIAGLVRTSDKTELKAELDLYESINGALYTSASFGSYTESYNFAKIIYADDTSSIDDVSRAVLDMQKEYASLVLRGDKTELIKVLGLSKKTDCSKYTPQSIKELDTAFDVAYIVYKDEDASQSAIDQAAALVKEKMDLLVLQADFEKLGELIQKVGQINPKDYNKSSINNLKEQYDIALAVFEDRNSSQSDVNMALASLQIAFNGLVEAGNVDELRSLLQEIKDLKWYLYAADGIRALKDKYDYAVELLNEESASGKDVNSLIALLNKLKGELIQRADKVELYNYLLKCEAVDLTNKSNKTAKEFRNAYSQAYNTLLNMDANEHDVAESLSAMQGAENGLKNATLAWWAILLIVIGCIIVVAIIIFVVLILF
ncbi:MAG: FIVAR domain-containing protein [Christensenellaceae bacterium]|nr:FIVAR domain-containing protein [Christensenellaceae bacterium]